MPVLEPHQRDALLERNRKRIGYKPEIKEDQEPPESQPTPAPKVEPEKPPSPQEEPSPKENREARASAKRDMYIAGQGGREHKYIQQLIKQTAQERGYMASIEYQIEGGSIDVALEREGMRIACEVSITTKPEHEFGNIEKCLSAGFERVYMISSNQKHLAAIRRYAADRLSARDTEWVHFLLPNEAIFRLDEIAATEGFISEKACGSPVRCR